jgi:triacylglycerol esterase/lipase EstA (alpha/beta hydrolase family)
MKKFIAMFLSVFFVFFIMACVHEEMEMETWNITVKVHNNSDYDVTDVWILGYSEPNISKLEKGSEQTLSLAWEEFKNTKIGQCIEIEYKINGERFDVEHQEDAVWFKTLPIGHWEWEEDGVRHELSMIGESNHGENDGSYISLQHFTNSAEIDIFIDNESYKIEGGVFERIRIPLLPPWLRDDYPESYFEFDRPPTH